MESRSYLDRHGIPDFTDEAVAKLNGTSFSGNMLASSDSSLTLRFGIADMHRVLNPHGRRKETT